jgi:endonuclease/exonuclease/phosphatase family metal-dependent hydrolase
MSARRLAAPLLIAVLASTAGCAPARNYLDRSGPRYVGDAAVSAHSENLKVVTFNIRYAREIGRAIDLLRSNPALRHADIVALQEMDREGVERIAAALGLAYVYYPAAVHPAGRKDFGNAVLVRGRIEEDGKLLLPHPGRFGGMQRIAVRVTARVAGERVRIYSTHLGTPKEVSASARADQVAAIVQDALSADGPVVVAGDFNNRGGVAEAFQRAGFTWLTRDVGRTIGLFSWDHVFVRGLPPGPARRSGAADSRGASDHRAVWAELPLARTTPSALPERMALGVTAGSP